ncbi:FAD/NAD P-binding domain-containing protein [Gloeophyllum trabeum ATCC 11539]|uniref:FAD/NAD P-binding domain-containing protein n=1 Tax=Gloeophyllum trabeum (strain ATCC 11539 / FP-39264 / Madison 617) TaxID=670483 RepID=S7QE74_GLOTA|nr:FAD/NAD P-binding domain-containing protein [Gloeophyllum trabeum ATCC 11539]EPQ57593.1 FAD/NAD P-binding domain-containing protein [Gloeophyllum trabeum ATCC 11539]
MFISKDKGKAPLSLEFIVVGGGVAGLAAAVGLRRAGHKVIVLEEEEEGTQDRISGGSRSPPNMTKVLQRNWDLGPEYAKIATHSENVAVLNYHTGDLYGTHHWDEELMQQTGGNYTTVHHADLCRLLAKSAASQGAQIRKKAKVVSVDGGSLKKGDRPSVSLASGEKLSADVIVGADGADSTVRRSLLGDTPLGEPTGLLSWNTTAPWSEVESDPELEYFRRKDTVYTHYGVAYASLFYYVEGPGGERSLALHFWTPDDGTLKDPGRGSWRDPFPSSVLVKALGEADPRLIKLARAAKPAVCLRSFIPPPIDWVCPDAAAVLISEAAHPLPAASVQQHGMAIGDAACLSELFRHMTAYDQLPQFLEAFEDVRRPRVADICENEVGNIRFMTCPPGPMQEARDAVMKAATDNGKGVLEGEEMYDAILKVFAYDPVDAAADWWVQWGMLNERAKGRVAENMVPLDIAVEQTTGA